MTKDQQEVVGRHGLNGAREVLRQLQERKKALGNMTPLVPKK